MVAKPFVTVCTQIDGIFFLLARINLVPRVFSLSNMAAAGEKTLEHSELQRLLIGASIVHSHVRSHWFIPPKQRWLPFEGFVEAEKCFLQCLRPKRWTEVRSDYSENCDCTVGRQRLEDSDI